MLEHAKSGVSLSFPSCSLPIMLILLRVLLSVFLGLLRPRYAAFRGWLCLYMFAAFSSNLSHVVCCSFTGLISEVIVPLLR